ncbi:MAG: hypothetical protein RL562_2493 [Planctomycetota bacterium]|jgi:hypothetical protein
MDNHDAQRNAAGRSLHGWNPTSGVTTPPAAAVSSRPLPQAAVGASGDASSRTLSDGSSGFDSTAVDIPVVPEGAVLPRLDRAPRRVLFFGKSKSRSRCTGALVDALERNGLEVRWRSIPKLRRWMGRRLALDFVRREFARFRPDIVFVFFMDLPEVLLDEFQGRTTIVQWIEEAFPEFSSRQVEYVRRVDLACFSDPELLPRLQQLGMRHGCFQMSGFSTRFHYPAKRRNPVRDLAFIGGPGVDRQRARFLLELARHWPIDVFGLGWEDYRGVHRNLRIRGRVDNHGYRRICSSSRIVLGMNQFNQDRLYFSNRVWLTLACRGFHLTHHVPGIETLFGRGEHLDWFHDLDEAVAKIEHYLGDEPACERIAEAGWRLAVGQHQYEHRIASVLDVLAGRIAPGSDVSGWVAGGPRRFGLLRGDGGTPD